MAPSDSRKSRISATRIDVSWRQIQRTQPVTSRPVQAIRPRAPGVRAPPKEPGTAVSTGAVDNCDPASPSSPSALTPMCRLVLAGSGVPSSSGVAADSDVLPVSVVLMGQIPTVKPSDQVCACCTMPSQAPVSRSRPVTIIIPPPIRITQV